MSTGSVLDPCAELGRTPALDAGGVTCRCPRDSLSKAAAGGGKDHCRQGQGVVQSRKRSGPGACRGLGGLGRAHTALWWRQAFQGSKSWNSTAHMGPHWRRLGLRFSEPGLQLSIFFFFPHLKKRFHLLGHFRKGYNSQVLYFGLAHGGGVRRTWPVSTSSSGLSREPDEQQSSWDLVRRSKM